MVFFQYLFSFLLLTTASWVWALDDFVPEDVFEMQGTSSNVFLLDANNIGGDITLQFGETLGKYVQWNDTLSLFEINDDLSFQGNQMMNVRLENQATPPVCDGSAVGKIYYNTTHNQSYTCNGSGWKTHTNLYSASGRNYLYTDRRWITWSGPLYGINNYNWSTTGGTAVNPAHAWNNIGFWLPKGTRIIAININGRADSTQVTDIENTWMFRYPDPATRWESGMSVNNQQISENIYRNFFFNNTDPGQPAFAGTMTNMHQRNYSMDYVTPEDGWVDMYVRPVGTLSATRYFYSTISIEYILP